MAKFTLISSAVSPSFLEEEEHFFILVFYGKGVGMPYRCVLQNQTT
jgi:hypothetical protein